MRKLRNPSYDLARHIITGERGPLSGEGIVRDIDNAWIDYEDPAEFRGVPGMFEGQGSAAINAANLDQARGLDSAATDGEVIDMAQMSGNHGLPGSQSDTLGYGPSPFDKWVKDNKKGGER